MGKKAAELPSSKQVLKILCIHGFMQNDQVLYKRTSALRKKLKNLAAFTYLPAPFELPPLPEFFSDPEASAPAADESKDAAETSPPRTWWSYGSYVPGSIELFKKFEEDESMEFVGLQTSLDLLKDTWSKESFDGILAFSQGAAMAAIFLHSIFGPSPTIVLDRPPKFAILVSGFCRPRPSNLLGYPAADSTKLEIPSLHVYSKDDKYVTTSKSEELVTLFKDPEVMIHPSGHFIPQKKENLEVFGAFLSKFTV